MDPAALYDRFSPRPNAAEAAESTARHDRCLAYCEFARLAPRWRISDPDTSARKVPLGKRDSGADLMALTTGKNPEARHVVAVRLDRLFRDQVDGLLTLAKWRKAQVTLHLADEGGTALNTATATGRFLIGILLAKCEYEPALTAERTRDAMKSHDANGRVMSSIVRYGYREAEPIMVRGELRRMQEEDEEEQEQIQRMVVWYLEGKRPGWIARQLTAEGVPTRGNRFRGAAPTKWDPRLVARILRRAGVLKQI